MAIDNLDGDVQNVDSKEEEMGIEKEMNCYCRQIKKLEMITIVKQVLKLDGERSSPRHLDHLHQRDLVLGDYYLNPPQKIVVEVRSHFYLEFLICYQDAQYFHPKKLMDVRYKLALQTSPIQ